jgi:hypothetical protein
VVFVVFVGSVADDATFQSDEHSIIQALSYEEIVELDTAGKLRAPTVLKAISDYRDGQQFPLSTVQYSTVQYSTVQAWHIETLSSITVEKDP